MNACSIEEVGNADMKRWIRTPQMGNRNTFIDLKPLEVYDMTPQ